MMLRQPDQGLWWSSVTGMLEPGEAPEAGAHREVLEETGLRGRLTPLGFAHTFWVDPSLLGLPEGEPRFNTEMCFHMEVDPSQVVRLDPTEHSEFRWCSFEEALALARWEGTKAALHLLRNQLATNP